MLRAGEPGDVLLPSCLNTIVRVLKHEPRLRQKYSFLLPAPRSLSVANDKWRLHELCQSLDIRTPQALCPTAVELRAAADRLRYPVVVKFRHDEDLYSHAGQRYRIAAGSGELIAHWEHFDSLQPRPVVQEYVSGQGYGFAALYDADGEFAAGFVHRRLVEHPASGGPSAVCESVKVPELEAIARRVLDHLSWRGVAMVEFKQCAETGEYYLLEINPRFWGSLPLAEAAGINFPYLLYKAALGEQIPPTDYRVGVRMRLLPTYLLSVWSSFRAAPWHVGSWLPKLSYLVDPRVHEGLFALDDLRPAFAYVRSRARGS
jgi:predicted ATP-grasp superfamily ATP-dependent carboligase